MKTLNIYNKNNFSRSLVIKYNRSRTWGFTISIVDTWTDKKIAYAGGCGYSKVSGVLTDFIWENFKDTAYLKVLRERIDSGYLAGWNEMNIPDLEKFFLHLGYYAMIKKLDKSKYPVFKVELEELTHTDMYYSDFEELQETFIKNNQSRYNEIIKEYEEEQEKKWGNK